MSGSQLKTERAKRAELRRPAARAKHRVGATSCRDRARSASAATHLKPQPTAPIWACRAKRPLTEALGIGGEFGRPCRLLLRHRVRTLHAQNNHSTSL